MTEKQQGRKNRKEKWMTERGVERWEDVESWKKGVEGGWRRSDSDIREDVRPKETEKDRVEEREKRKSGEGHYH